MDDALDFEEIRFIQSVPLADPEQHSIYPTWRAEYPLGMPGRSPVDRRAVAIKLFLIGAGFRSRDKARDKNPRIHLFLDHG